MTVHTEWSLDVVNHPAIRCKDYLSIYLHQSVYLQIKLYTVQPSTDTLQSPYNTHPGTHSVCWKENTFRNEDNNIKRRVR